MHLTITTNELVRRKNISDSPLGPPEGAYWIQIVSSNDNFSWMKKPVNEWYGHILLHFDHYDPNHIYDRRTKFFDTQDAHKLLDDFEQHFNIKEKKYIDHLFVSCEYGKNRSPAIAMALNDLYDLGHNTIHQNYAYYAKDVYLTLLETGMERCRDRK